MGSKLSNLAKEIISSFNDMGKILAGWIESPYDPQLYGPGVTRKKYYAIYNLNRRKFIKTKKIKNKTYLKLTPRGKKELIKILLNEINKNKKWNGKWYVLIFDIPEKRRRYRIHLINTLKNIGFYQLQKSVWIFPFDVLNYLYELMPGFREGDWFEYIEASKISSSSELKKYFNLK